MLFLAKIASNKKGSVAQALINDAITVEVVRLIGPDGGSMGIVPIAQARQVASDAELDLVLISADANPPVCKVLDYGKYRYDLQKKKTESKKKQKTVDIKEVQLRPYIGENDLVIKCRAIKKFIEAGNKVKVVLRFRGRELRHQALGAEVLTKLMGICGEFCKEDNTPKLDGSVMMLMLSAKSGKD